jgi:hypothetical protein
MFWPTAPSRFAPAYDAQVAVDVDGDDRGQAADRLILPAARPLPSNVCASSRLKPD